MVKRALMVVAVVFGLASSALAQTVPESAEEAIPSQLAPVFVQTTSTDQQVRGHLLDLSERTMTILENGNRRVIPLDQIRRIQVSGDRVKNGAIIGAAFFGGYCAVVCGIALPLNEQYAAAVMANAGLGALLGAGIDALHHGRTTIFRK